MTNEDVRKNDVEDISMENFNHMQGQGSKNIAFSNNDCSIIQDSVSAKIAGG